MFRVLFMILVPYILIFQIGLALRHDNANNTVCECNCNCNMQIEVLDDELDEDVRKSENKSDPKASNNNSQLRGKRAASNCVETEANSMNSGVYKIQIPSINVIDFEVFCEEEVDFGGWLVIQRRQSGDVNFTRNWQDYKNGFGDVTGNYWIGLEAIHALTSSCEQELYIQLKRRNGGEYYAKYSEFRIANETENYALINLGSYSGNAGDSLSPHLGKKFSTNDRDNDNWKNSCAKYYQGAWWFDSCYKAFLNGVYGDDTAGVNWIGLIQYESLSFAQMMIRPTQKCLMRMMFRSRWT